MIAVKTSQNEPTVSKWDEKDVSFRSPKMCPALEIILARDVRGPFPGRVGLNGRLLGLGLRERGAEDTSLVVFEALDFGLHVLEAGLFGGEGRCRGF